MTPLEIGSLISGMIDEDDVNKEFIKFAVEGSEDIEFSHPNYSLLAFMREDAELFKMVFDKVRNKYIKSLYKNLLLHAISYSVESARYLLGKQFYPLENYLQFRDYDMIAEKVISSYSTERLPLIEEVLDSYWLKYVNVNELIKNLPSQTIFVPAFVEMISRGHILKLLTASTISHFEDWTHRKLHPALSRSVDNYKRDGSIPDKEELLKELLYINIFEVPLNMISSEGLLRRL